MLRCDIIGICENSFKITSFSVWSNVNNHVHNFVNQKWLTVRQLSRILLYKHRS